jgi:hypothetical protein
MKNECCVLILTIAVVTCEGYEQIATNIETLYL